MTSPFQRLRMVNGRRYAPSKPEMTILPHHPRETRSDPEIFLTDGQRVSDGPAAAAAPHQSDKRMGWSLQRAAPAVGIADIFRVIKNTTVSTHRTAHRMSWRLRSHVPAYRLIRAAMAASNRLSKFSHSVSRYCILAMLVLVISATHRSRPAWRSAAQMPQPHPRGEAVSACSALPVPQP